jgi:hypothetical protein
MSGSRSGILRFSGVVSPNITSYLYAQNAGHDNNKKEGVKWERGSKREGEKAEAVVQ